MINNTLEKWEEKTLGDICLIGAGNSAPQDKDLFENGIYPFFRTADVGKIHFGKINSSEDLLNEKGIKGLKLFKKGTILIPKSGASTFLNHRVKMEVDGFVVSHLATVKGRENVVNDDFLLYYLLTIKVQDLIQDQNYPSVNLPIISNIKIMLPPLPEQERIVAKLDEAFEAIDKVKASAEQNLNNAKELFDGYLENIVAPKDKLGKYIKITTGKLNSNAAIENGQYPFFTCSRTPLRINNYSFDCEAILLAGNNASGDFNVKHYKGKFNAYQRTYVITIQDKSKLNYRYLYFQLFKALAELKKMSLGANTKFLRVGMITDFMLSMPTIEEQQKIVEKLDALQEQTKQLEQIYTQKIKECDELKQSILQKAFRGEL